MIQGLNCECSIYRDTVTDDDIGGAVPVSGLVYSKVKCRVSSVRPTQFSREQGVETPKLYNVIIQPATYAIREKDDFYLTNPIAHEIYHKLIPVEGVQIDSIAPSDVSRRHIELTLSRIVRSRTE